MSGIYSFIKGISGKLGTGTADLGFARSQSIGLQSVTGPGVAVRRSLGAYRPAMVKTAQQTVIANPYGLTGRGLSGTFNPTTLARPDGGGQ